MLVVEFYSFLSCSLVQVSQAKFAEFQDAFRAALSMRYRFLPFLYSLAHAAHRHSRPIAHPASFTFPSECSDHSSQRCMDARNTYMVGGVLVPSDLGLAHTSRRVQTPDGDRPPLENTSTAILPAATLWFRFNTTTTFHGGQTVRQVLRLAEMAIYVRAGAILPLQANASIQRSGEAGGLLEVHVYAGDDGGFTMVEDDGISWDYRDKPDTATRTTTWRWIDASKTLVWSVSGGKMLDSPNLYSAMTAVLFEKDAQLSRRSSVQPMTMDGGRVVFG